MLTTPLAKPGHKNDMSVRLLWLLVLGFLPALANAQILGVPVVSTSAGGVISATNVYSPSISTSTIYVSGTIYTSSPTNPQYYPYGKSMIIRTTAATFSLASGAAKTLTASCISGEVVTGGGCSDGGNKIFYYFGPDNDGFDCGWDNGTGSTISGITGTAYANCLR